MFVNQHMEYVAITYLPLIILLVVSVVQDFLHQQIPNILVLVGLLYGLMLAFLGYSHVNLADAFLGMTVGSSFFIYPYLKSYIGAGDVKLMAMVGLFLGPQTVAVAALCTMMMGGLLALIYAINKRLLKYTFTNLRSWHVGVIRFPYALAILSGTLCAIVWRGIE